MLAVQIRRHFFFAFVVRRHGMEMDTVWVVEVEERGALE